MKEILKIILYYFKRLRSEFIGLGLLTLTKAFSFLGDKTIVDKYTSYGMAFLVTIAILKVMIGLKTPLTDYLPKTKVEKTSNLATNEDYYAEKLEVIKNIKKGKMFMKKILVWLDTNKLTLSGFMVFALYILDNIFEWSSKWNLPNEWQYSLVAIIFIIVSWAIKGRGLENLTLVTDIRKIIKQFKHEKKIAKEEFKKIKRKERFIKKYGFEPPVPPSQPPTHPNRPNNSPIRKVDRP